ncbi:MAG: penicillin-binding transpeptidase domain-containing protein [Eubacteriales bacterium]|nr:penicillin-binding transpeptidase domain-containing protein [Eubacteriales bacterium]
MHCKTFHRKKILIVFAACLLMMAALAGRLVYLMVFEAEYYQKLAEDLHERERSIKAARGRIIDRTGTVLADNRTVCTISVIHSQIEDPEGVIGMLSRELDMEEETVRKRVEKVSSIERIKSNVDQETGDAIRAYGYAGVKVDEDFKRYYPYGELASKVLGFTGSDNQGIIGLEVRYDEYLEGSPGTILTLTDARGIEIENAKEERVEPVAGNDLRVSLDYNIQSYAQQEALKVLEAKEADYVSILIMNPQNGEIYACVNVPEFDLNDPFTLNTPEDVSSMTEQEKQDALNRMWRNQCVNDTYEPGSTFKIFTSSAALLSGTSSLSDQFYCPGYRIVEDRRIRCHKAGGHGPEDFTEAMENSCNPALMEMGLRMGADRFYESFSDYGLLSATGIDIPGEASTIMHKKDAIGEVELATMTFGQSFQITPVQLAVMASSVVNGGRRITPHFAAAVQDRDGNVLREFDYEVRDGIVTEEVSAQMREILEKVVSEGSGNKAYLEGYRIGGKTATSQTLPRSARKYISSFLGFAPADDPQVLAVCIVHDPQGVYYGGTVCAPVVKNIFANILPYLGIEKEVSEDAGEERE